MLEAAPKRSLKLADLVLMNLVAVVSLRWLASAATAGPAALSLWVLAALFFFIPEGLAVAELQTRFPEGGLYGWTRRAFGDAHAFLCGWCYWMNSLIYFPGLLLFIAANAALVLEGIFPGLSLSGSRAFLLFVTLGSLWLVAGLSLLGMRVGRWLSDLGSLGTWIPLACVIGLAGVAWARMGSANPITPAALLPRLGDWGALSLFSQMCFALAGLELMSFFSADIVDPRRSITRATLLSAALIGGVYLLGTLAILVSIPQARLTAMNGVLLPIQELSSAFGAPGLARVAGAALILQGLAATLVWFSGAARLPYLVGVDRHLPPSFGRLHPRFGTPHVAILWQAVFATAVTLLAVAGSATESAYKVLVDLCLILYFIPYAYLFGALYRLRAQALPGEAAYRVPFGRRGNAAASLAGLAATLLAIAFTLLPGGAEVDWAGLAKTAGGTALMLSAGWALRARA